jgi:hypothetical protein
MTRAVALTERQLRFVQHAAQSVPLNHRPDFLNGIADELMQQELFTDADVMAATARMAERYADACGGGDP